MAGGIELAPLLTKIKVDIDGFKAQMSDAANVGVQKAKEMSESMSKITKVGDTLTNVGGKLTNFVTVPIAGAITAATNFAIKFEDSFAQVSTLLDKGSTDFGAYKKDIIQGSNLTGIAIDEYAESVYGAISAGVEQGKAVEFTTEAMKLAKGGFTDGASAVDIMTTALNGYKLETSEASRVADLLINTQNLGKTTVNELASSMGKVIPVASAANFNIEELSTSYAVLTKNGIGTAEAGTYLTAMLAEMSKTGSITDTTLKELSGKGFAALKEEGKSTTDILNMLKDSAEKNNMTLSDMFSSSEAGRAALVLLSEGGAEYNEILESMGGCAGAANDAFETMNETTGAKLKNSINKLKNTMIQFGDAVAPIVEKVADLLSKVGDKLSGLNEEQVNTILKVGLVLAAIGPLFTIVGKGIKVFVALKSAFAGISAACTAAGTTISAVVAPIGIAIAAVAALFVAWQTNFGGIRDKTAEMMESIKSIIESVWNFIKGLWDNNFLHIQDICATAWANIELVFSTALDIISGVLKVVSQVLAGDWDGALNTIKETTSTVWDNIKQIFENILSTLKLVVEDALIWICEKVGVNMEDVKTLFETIWENIKLVFDTVLTAIKGAWDFFSAIFKEDWKAAWEAVKDTASSIWDNIKQLASNTWNGIVKSLANIASSLWSTAKETFNKVLEGAKEIWNNLTTWLSNAVKNLPDIIKGIGSALYNAGSSIFSSLWDGLTSVWSSISSWVSEKVSWLADKITFWNNGKSKISGSHYNGLNYVPYDGYTAVLHKGERVLTAKENEAFNNGQAAGGDNKNGLTLNIENFVNNREQDVRELAQEFEFYRKYYS